MSELSRMAERQVQRNKANPEMTAEEFKQGYLNEISQYLWEFYDFFPQDAHHMLYWLSQIQAEMFEAYRSGLRPSTDTPEGASVMFPTVWEWDAVPTEDNPYDC